MPVDFGIRCDRHVGEVFQVRCYECERAAREQIGHRPEIDLAELGELEGFDG